MEREAVGDLVEAVSVELLQRLGRRLVQGDAAGRQQTTVGDLANAIVHEVQLIAHRVEYPPRDELLHGLGGFAPAEARDMLTQKERGLATDDCRRAQHVAFGLAQAAES